MYPARFGQHRRSSNLSFFKRTSRSFDRRETRLLLFITNERGVPTTNLTIAQYNKQVTSRFAFLISAHLRAPCFPENTDLYGCARFLIP
uniref:Uncharacterized protein n=1 Tax=Steinernema glaseri TaxID=37863 RepID=A0A1I8AJR0_9BILA